MRILAIERDRPTPPLAILPDLLRDEAAGVWDLMKRGIIRDIWFTAADRHAVIMLECQNAAEAREHLETLPLVRFGQIDFILYELCSYDGLDRLFGPGVGSPTRKQEEPAEY